jgi:hypothetical protein
MDLNMDASSWRSFLPLLAALCWQAMNRPGAFDFLFERAGLKGERRER